MVHNFEAILHEENELNPITKIQHKIFASTILNHKLSTNIKLAKIAIVQVLKGLLKTNELSNYYIPYIIIKLII
jgi:hypothetical protein